MSEVSFKTKELHILNDFHRYLDLSTVYCIADTKQYISVPVYSIFSSVLGSELGFWNIKIRHHLKMNRYISSLVSQTKTTTDV